MYAFIALGVEIRKIVSLLFMIASHPTNVNLEQVINIVKRTYVLNL